MSKVKQLEKKFGGRWKYRGSSYWECLDNDRAVWTVHDCSCDDENCPTPPAYYLYEDGIPQRIQWDQTPILFKLCERPKI